MNNKGTRRGNHNCPSHINRPCSNRTCNKVACATYHSFGLCEICATDMPLICENIEYGRFTALKRAKCKGTYSSIITLISLNSLFKGTFGICNKETQVRCSNAACKNIVCRSHIRLLCLGKSISHRDLY